jgi:hypothetical protein
MASIRWNHKNDMIIQRHKNRNNSHEITNELARMENKIVLNTKILETKVVADTIEFTEYLRNKRVVIVGPSSSLNKRGLGEEIEKFDVVVRLNKAMHMKCNRNDYGHRIDVLYNNMCYYEPGNDLRTKDIKNKNIKYLVSAYPMIPPFQKDIISYLMYAKGRIPVIVPPIESYYGLIGGLQGSRPYTGMCAIYDILRYPIKSLHVYGVDFYLTGGYNRGYGSKKSLNNIKENGVHSATKHQIFLRNNLFKFYKLHYDPKVVEILFNTENLWTRQIQKATAQFEFFYNPPKLTTENIWITSNLRNYNTIKNGQIWTYWDGTSDLIFSKNKGIQVICPYANNIKEFWSSGGQNNINCHVLWELEKLNPWHRELTSVEKVVMLLIKYSKKKQIHLFKQENIDSTWLNYLAHIGWITLV